MLPVCSATTCSSHSQVFLTDGLRYFSRSQKTFDVTVRCLSGEASMPSLSSGVLRGMYVQKEAATSLYTDFVGGRKSSDSYFMGGSHGHLTYVEDSASDISKEEFVGDTVVDSPDILIEPAIKEPTSILDSAPDSTANVPDGCSMNTESAPSSSNSIEDFLSQTKESISASTSNGEDMPSSSNIIEHFLSQTNESLSASTSKEEDIQNSSNSIDDFVSQANESIGTSISTGKDAVSSSVDKVTSAIQDIIKDVNDALDKLTKEVLSSVDQTGEVTRDKVSNLPSDLKEASSRAGVVALELLRKTILVVVDSLLKGSKVIYHSYETFKEVLPPDFQNAINSFEGKASEVSRPVATVILQVYSAIEGLERSLGIDPSDPVVPFVLLVGTTSALWTVYWVVTYSGYAGDLPPNVAMDILKGRDNAALIDVRPEDLKQQDGIPDLRRAARSRYADVSLPKVDGSLKKLLKSSKDLDDILVATVIRNLKNVQDRSKVIVMDADGNSAKGIARSLRKLGIKRPYVLQGGFKSWVKEGLRVKELRPETAITILNEEAEAILEELSPSPVQLLAFGVGSVAAVYALLEWEKSLQLIGFIGLAQTIYRRLASYEDSEDFRKDVRLLLSPVTMGTQALSWATGKVETNGNGLPVSPSSSDVQSRVLQAAAKHESQPFDTEGSQDSALDSPTTTVDENMDPSDA